MTPTETPVISQVEQLLAENGYEVTEIGDDVLRVRDLETGIAFQAALQGNVLFMSVVLQTCPASQITPDMMKAMLSAANGISTSSFQLYESGDKTAVTLNNFCTLQNMGEEDKDDVLSLASYLMADVLVARDVLDACQSATQA
jgi:hypothetical protein